MDYTGTPSGHKKICPAFQFSPPVCAFGATPDRREQMKLLATTLTMLSLSALAYCQSEPPTTDRTIAVCVAPGAISGVTIPRAKMLASEIFGQIGVVIEWQQMSRNCATQAIRVSMSAITPEIQKPGAFAYALPYEGTHIEVFYDRIENVCKGPMMEIVLAHVLVHEITHILEGVKRHSEQGVMKAKWNRMDYVLMTQRHLEFAPEDVQLIYVGLAARQKLAMLAMNTDEAGHLLAVNNSRPLKR
jgi:hypothetical protein